MSNQPDLTIIILNFNAVKWLDLTLSTLKKYVIDKSQFQLAVWVVDNASADDSVAMVKKQHPWCRLIELKTNGGFAAGNNVALKQVKSRYAMLLNSDVESTELSLLDPLINYLDQHQQVGIITPKLVLADGSIDPACHRGEPTPWAAITYYAQLEKLFPRFPLFAQYHQFYKPLNQIHQIDACSGAAMLIRTQVMAKVGLLDERFFMYAEDLDWCKRFRESGYDVIYYPEVVLIHHKKKSGIGSQKQAVSKQTKHHFYHTMMQYYDKHYQHRYPGYVRSFLKLLINIKKGA